MRIALAVAIVALAVSLTPSTAEACSCGGAAPSSTAFKAADLIFVGTVARFDARKPVSRVNADGSGTIAFTTEPTVATFDVTRTFRGSSPQQVVITGDATNCDEPFKQGETWLIYARVREGRVTTDKCTRTRPLSEAAQDVAYLEGLEQNRAQGIVYGDVQRRMISADGRAATQALFERLQVIAVGAGRRVETTTDEWGPFQLVLPVGDFEIWVERAGVAVAPRQVVHVNRGADQRVVLLVEYKN